MPNKPARSCPYCLFYPVFLILSFILFTNIAHSEEATINIQVKSNIKATASYSAGDKIKPAVLLIHGFLGTRDHATLKNLTNAIKDEGYSTLAPTLSLGIDKRKQSLACEAIHTHTMESDVSEINLWVQWLIKKGHKKVILLGHSFGSLNMLVYLKQHQIPEITYAIATSLIDIEHAIGKQSVKNQLKEAYQQIKNNNKSLNEYKISYCKKFISTAETFVSYAKWDKKNILSLLKFIKKPVHIIMGENDQRMEKNWPNLLSKHGKKVDIINGANHFFSDEFEFELHDQVINTLNKI